ncbi:MAG: winged helix-turn-helix domain-containing protein [Bauldia sp.]|nr:winged helix-turn-helix domain-containing protein [Bauldia sp.]
MIEPVDLIAHASDAGLVVDGRQRVLAINEAALGLLGRVAADVVGLRCDQLVSAVRPDGGRLCSARCEAIVGFGLCQPYTSPSCFVQRKDGSRLAVALRTIAIPGDAADLDRPVALIFLSRSTPDAADAANIDPRLHIHTLGRFAVSLRGCCLPLEQWPRKQAIHLLKLLASHVGRPLHRERLVEHLWPDADPEAGWARLKVTAHFLRQRLREAGLSQEAIVTTDASYLLRRDCVWIDALAFEDLVREGRAHQDAGRISEAINAYEEARKLYCGDYMEANLYADWCAEERERLGEVYLELLSGLAELHFARSEYAAAAQTCQTALVREPCRESVHRRLISCFIAMQRADSALRQFHRCVDILRAEMDVAPAPETVALIAPLVRGKRASAGLR